MNRPKPDQDEIALFRRSIGPVTSVKQDNTHYQTSQPKPKPKRIAGETDFTDEKTSGFFDNEEIETSDELSFKRPGVQNREFRKLKQGKLPISTESDLHGLTIEAAKAELSDFLEECRRRNHHCVKIIHGKGLRSKQGERTIKSQIGKWLRQRQEILAYHSAKQTDGGTGALYVLMKKQKK